MSRALRFIARMYLLPSVAALAVMSALGLVFSQIIYLEVFATWYIAQPMFSIIFATIYSFTLVNLYRQLALSANCLRRDFFWACQVAFLLFALSSAAISAVIAVLPRLFHFGYDLAPATADAGLFDVAPMYAEPKSWLVLFVLVFFLQLVGAAMGELYSRNKVLSTVLMVVVMLLFVVGVVVIMFVTMDGLDFGSAPVLIALGVSTGIGLVCDILFARANARAVVR